MAKKHAAQYPITFPYGAKYAWGGTHHGDDRAMPIGTPVKVSRKLVGYSGNTGFSTGPHLHVDKYIPRWGWLIGPRKYFNPEDKGTFNIKGRVVFAGWLGTAGKCVIVKEDTKNTDGKRVFYRFLHLDMTSKKRGDWI